jgi:two-component system sporulation sensor kinase C
MIHIFYPAIVNMSGTLLMTIIFVYLYYLYSERYIGLWLTSWITYLWRTVLFDSGLLDWIQSILGFTIYQFMSIASAEIFTYGTILFVGRRFPKWWLYGGIVVFFLNEILALLQISILYKVIPFLWFCAAIYIWAGTVFIRHLKINGVGKQITGYTYIIWGIHALNKPFLIEIPSAAIWGYLMGDMLRLLIAVGTLVIYFEKARIDLAKKETQYRLLADNAVDVIYRYRILPEVKFEYISPSVVAVTGYTSEEFYADAKLFESLIHPDDLLMFKQYTNNPSSPNNLPLKYCLIHKDKSRVYIEQKYLPIYDETGNLVIREGVLRDVTARDDLEQITARADRMNLIGEMAANVAHEIRNPLTTVRGYLQMMVSKDELSNYRNRFGLMMEELDRANTIISEYLLLAKDKRAELKNCSLNTIIDKLFPLIKADAIASNVLVKLDLKEISTLYLDENEIRQLLLNLVRNGVEAMPAGGELTICTGLEQDKIVLSVKDQGTGLPAHVLENLGTPFLTTKGTGTGLGLPICYRIANRHNAMISVKTDDQGTTFCVSFNLACLAS